MARPDAPGCCRGINVLEPAILRSE
jgi:hypothetical protein